MPPRPLLRTWLTAGCAALLVFAACANPQAPSGGPRDETPPSIASSDPAADAVNVSAEHVDLVFSEYIDVSSFAEAFSLTPAFEEPLAFDWSGRRVRVELPAPLRDSTTYVLTIDTDLRDERGVALAQPLTLAFATGPDIDRGRLAGRVLGAARGQGLAGLDVYAYAAPDSTALDSLPDAPAYRTQTDPEGAFQFDYLREQPYYVVALADRNRNRQPDPLEAYAVPPRPALSSDTSDAARIEAPWVATARDTIPPTLNRVQALSDRRLVLRFSEPVRLARRDTAGWTLRDSLADQRRAVQQAFTRPDDPLALYLLTEMLRPELHTLRPGDGLVTDTVGNALLPTTARFTPTEEADTVQTRFVGFTPENLAAGDQQLYTLPPETAPGLRFNQPLDTTRLRSLLTAADTTGRPRAFALSSPDGVTYRLQLVPPLQPAEAVRLALDARPLGADTTFARTFRRLSDRELGELSGVVALSGSAPIIVELYDAGNPEAAPRRTQTGPDGEFLFANLPEASFRYRAFADRNENGRWDAGRLAPYAPAEPITWSAQPIQTRPRWETALDDTLRLSASAP